MIANVNCSTTNNFLGVIRALAALKVPFNTFEGLNEDIKKAGYDPAIIPVNKIKPSPLSQNLGCLILR